MKYCQKCGHKLDDNENICPICGSTLKTEIVSKNNMNCEVSDSVNGFFVALSVLFPIFGLIYWVLKYKTRPRCAKYCGIAALITWAIGLLSTCSML